MRSGQRGASSGKFLNQEIEKDSNVAKELNDGTEKGRTKSTCWVNRVKINCLIINRMCG